MKFVLMCLCFISYSIFGKELKHEICKCEYSNCEEGNNVDAKRIIELRIHETTDAIRFWRVETDDDVLWLRYLEGRLDAYDELWKHLSRIP